MRKFIMVCLIFIIGIMTFNCVTPEPENYILTIDVNDSTMGSVTVDPEQPANGYLDGTVVTLTPTATTGYEFSNWSGANSDEITEENTIVMDSDKTVQANFEVKTFSLTIDVIDINGVGDPSADGVVINKDPDLTEYPYNTQVSLTPEDLDLGTGQAWIFREWGDESTDIPKTITITEDTTVTAKFKKETVFKINVTTPTNGSIRVHDFGGELADGSFHVSGDDVDVYATPMAGYEFTGWSGDASGVSNPYTFTMDSDKSVGATFASVGTTSFIEDFEAGIDYDIWTRGWSVTGDDGEADAVISKDHVLNGENSMELFATNSGQRRMWNILNVDVASSSWVTFWVKVDCSPYPDGNGNKDKFMFFIDEASEADDYIVLSGHLGWQQYTFMLEPGEHELMWGFFAFNGQSSEGADAAFVDDIVFGDGVTIKQTGAELNVGYGNIDIPDDGGTTPVDLGIVGSDIPFSLYLENTGIQSQEEEDSITISSITLDTTTDLTITPPTLPLTLDIWDKETFTMTASGTNQITSGTITITSDYPTDNSEYKFKIMVDPTVPAFHDDFDGGMEPNSWSNMYYSANDYQATLPIIETGTGINGSDSLYFTPDEFTQIAVLDIDVGPAGAKIMSMYQFYDDYGYIALFDNTTSTQSYAASLEFEPTLQWSPFTYDLTPGVHEVMIKMYSGFGSYARMDEFVIIGDATVIPTEPNIKVEYDTYKYYEIPDGSVDYTIDNVLDSATLEFRISSIGKQDLELTGTPIINVSGDGTYSTSIIPDSIIEIGETTSFAVDVTAGLGPKDISISIPNNDTDKDPYNFNVMFDAENPTPRVQVVYEERIDDEWVETIIPNGGSITMDDIINLGNRDHEFIIRNVGTGTATLTNPRISLSNMTDFNILTMPDDQFIPPFGGIEEFEIVFFADGKTSGLYSTDITINEGTPYIFTVNINIATPTGIFSDDFESGIDLEWNGKFTGVVAPAIDNTYVHAGNSSLRLGNIEPTAGEENVAPDNDEYSGIYYAFSSETTKDHVVRFWYKVDAENTSGTYSDYLAIYRNGTNYARWKVPTTYVNDSWEYAEYLVPLGTETIEFRYFKNSYNSEGKDAAWIDDVEIEGIP